MSAASSPLNHHRFRRFLYFVTYRLNVGAVIQDAVGRIFLGERLDHPGCWQFPQGGVDSGETLERALSRELDEEISLRSFHYRIEDRSGPHRYLFPAGVTKKGCNGQEQTYFLLRLTVQPAVINLATAHPEFAAARWVLPTGFSLAWLPAMKHEVYRQVFHRFFGLEIT